MEKKKEKEESSSTSTSNDNPVSRPWQSYHTVFTNAKAGMDGVDKEKVQRVVYEMSKGSKYFENEERKEALMRQKVENMRARCAKLSSIDVSHYQKVAERRISELETTRDLSRTWLHVDMDAFYAAVETLSNPSLKGKPMAVGSMSMLSTANYEARKFGVRAAMPGFIARKLCPELIFVPTDFEKYTHYSSLTREVFKRYDPNFIAGSLDEAYLDITNVCVQRDVSSEEVAEEIRSSVYEETGLTCSAGVAPNRLLAKVCSDINKPNGQFILPNDRLAVMTFISSLPIRKIGGIGKVTEHILRDVFEIKTCEELLQKGGFLCALFSSSSADFFLSVGLGLGSTHTPEERLRKSMSSERTFSATNKEAFLYQKLAELAEMLSSDLQKERLRGRNLTLKLKTANFEIRSRAVTLQKYICASEDILRHSKKLLKAELPASLRLIGLRISHFSGEGAGPSDPLQRSITNFIISGDAPVNNVHGHDNSSSGLTAKDSVAANENADDLCGCNHGCACVHIDNLNSDHFSDFSFSNFGIDETATDMGRSSDQIIQAENSLHMASTPAVVGHITELRESAACLLSDTSSPARGCKPVDQSSWCTNSKRDDDAPSLRLQDKFRWVDDYKCSICGIEMPPDFYEERQEHSDFHLAEHLQEECSSSSFTNDLPRRRIIQKEPGASPSRQKRRKSLADEGKYLRIDKFFTKRSQNS